MSQSEIARQFNVSRGAVRNVAKNGIESERKNCGRPRKTSERDERMMTKILKRHRSMNANAILFLWNQHGIHLSRSSFTRRMRERGVRNYKKTPKFKLTAKSISKRYCWARKLLTMPAYMWNKIAWSDESNIDYNEFYNGHCYRTKEEKFDPDCVDKRVKHPLKIMVWGVISSQGVGELKFIEGTMRAVDYKPMLKNVIKPQLQKWFGRSRDYHFMHDHAPCHTAKIIGKEIEKLRIKLLPWPANSPDMNPIENVWKILKIRVARNTMENRRKYPNLTDLEFLKQAILEEWYSPSMNEIAKRCSQSAHRRVYAMFEKKGLWTKY